MAGEALIGFLFIVFQLVTSIWAATDAKKRGYSGLKMAFIFFLVLLLPLLGLLLYFVLRPSGKFVHCKKCKKKELPNLRECPHCGLDRPIPRGQQPPAGQYQPPPPVGQYQQPPPVQYQQPAGQPQQQPPPPPPPVAKPQTKIKCPHCGQMVENNWKTCPHCSRKIIIGKTIIDEVFLIYRDGRLIKHFTRRIKPDVDQDILSGMLTAVQDFIRDSFRGESGDLNHMQFGRFQILMGNGRFITVAAVLMGDEIEPFRPQIIKAIDQMEADYEIILRDWDGDVEQLNVLGRYIMDLIDGRYF